MEKIAKNILETIGNTPLIRLSRLNASGVAEVIAKVESFNPGGSAKDRVGAEMVRAAEIAGILKPGGTVVEPTSGNTGVGLAVACAVKEYKLILTMPDTMSLERRQLLAAYGAELVLTPGSEGMAGAIAKAREIVENTPGAFMPQQFENPANPAAHEHSTAVEILRDCGDRIDIFVAGAGTGGTLTGVAKVLKTANPAVRIIAVEPDTSAVLSGGKPGPHQLQGIGAGFIPKVLNTSLIDKIVPVSAADAVACTVKAARCEGILAGISSGAALFAALQEAEKPENKGKRIVVLLPDTGERYLSSGIFND